MFQPSDCPDPGGDAGWSGVFPEVPLSADPGWRRVPPGAEWPEWIDDEAFLAAREEPWDLADGGEDPDSDSAPPAGDG